MAVLGQVPAFSLTERSGKTLTLENLRGKVWVADFIFTNCSSICPMMTMRMARLAESLKSEPELRFVSFTVDPVRDTPSKLRTYASIYTKETEHWFFLTGDKKALYKLSQEGFHLTALDRPLAELTPGEDRLVHSERFVLVDGEGRIRSYYSGTDLGSIATLIEVIQHLLRTK